MIFLFPPTLVGTSSQARSLRLPEILSDWIGAPVRIEIAADYDDMVERVQHSRVAFAWAPPVVCAQTELQARAVYKSVRRGRTSYKAALIARRGEVKTLAQLRDMRAAWVDPLSSAGYLLPTQYLRSKGHPPEELLRSQVFLGNYRDCLNAVARKQADLTSVYLRDNEVDCPGRMLEDLISSRADSLEDVARTAETPADGLIIAQACAPEIYRSLHDQIADSVPDTLLETIHIDGLIPAAAGEYKILRQSLSVDPHFRKRWREKSRGN